MPWYIHTIDRIFSGKGCQSSYEELRVNEKGTLQRVTRYGCAVCEPYTAGRIQAAWWVLTGRAYALKWPQPGDLEAAINRE